MADILVQVLRGQSSTLPGTKEDGRLLFTTDEAHIYLDNGDDRVEFYKEDLDRVISRTYQKTLDKTQWTGSGPCVYTLDLTTLRANNPPLIICTDVDKTNYNCITNAIATSGVGITFTSDGPMTEDINLLIVDVG